MSKTWQAAGMRDGTEPIYTSTYFQWLQECGFMIVLGKVSLLDIESIYLQFPQNKKSERWSPLTELIGDVEDLVVLLSEQLVKHR